MKSIKITSIKHSAKELSSGLYEQAKKYSAETTLLLILGFIVVQTLINPLNFQTPSQLGKQFIGPKPLEPVATLITMGMKYMSHDVAWMAQFIHNLAHKYLMVPDNSHPIPSHTPQGKGWIPERIFDTVRILRS